MKEQIEQQAVKTIEAHGEAILSTLFEKYGHVLVDEGSVISILIAWLFVLVYSFSPSMKDKTEREQEYFKIKATILVSVCAFNLWSWGEDARALVLFSVIIAFWAVVLPMSGLKFIEWKFPKLAELLRPERKKPELFVKAEKECPTDATQYKPFDENDI